MVSLSYCKAAQDSMQFVAREFLALLELYHDVESSILDAVIALAKCKRSPNGTESVRIAFKRSRRVKSITNIILECDPELRNSLVNMDRVFVGWEAIPCGKNGHKSEECIASILRCATCYRFERNKPQTHRTASREYPAQKYAEERKYSDQIDVHLDHLKRVPNVLHVSKGLIVVDCNAHSPLWLDVLLIRSLKLSSVECGQYLDGGPRENIA
ncbi:hypothetical protein EVAR_14300_1 [Eumeta japonica]|uniref:Uncharacterized protein n=1 Tax=Eumeta variegata TaxID=151549 RepID=A0A4C1UMD3_EUMVA|nr:hypothetical protein EVAR_14300_1 [Eumeta japonica]